MKKEVLFIVNPISGGKSKQSFLNHLKLNKLKSLNASILIWEHSDDFSVISEQIKASNFDIYVAVGGDGTVNLVARNLINTKKILGIIPFGSGNGLARHLKIPLNPYKALRNLDSKFQILSIDSGLVNQFHFFCTCGFGFDAVVANSFSKLKNRGLFGYVSTTLKLLAKYKSPNYKITYNGLELDLDLYLLTIANANQFGNNVKIAPKAKLNDSVLDIVAVKNTSLIKIIKIGLDLIFNKILENKNVIYGVSDQFEIKSDSSFYFHIDGEPMDIIYEAKIKVLPKSILVAVPPNIAI